MIASITNALMINVTPGLLAALGSCLVSTFVLGMPMFLVRQQYVAGRCQWVRLGMASERSKPAQSPPPVAIQDCLTEVPGHLLLDQQLHRPGKQGHNKAVLVVGVDCFGAVNQLHGHGFGDELLKAIALRIRSGVRTGSLVVRLAGDEFAIVAEVEELGQAKALANRLMQEVQRPFQIDGRQVDVSVSVGIAMEAMPGSQRSKLLTQATVALAEAKDLGRNRLAVFDVLMGANATEVELMVGDLRRALREGEFFLMYQPKLDIRSGRVFGMEALLRWNHPEHGNVPPDHFIPLAEKTGMIVEIGRWVLNEACRQMQEWRHRQCLKWQISVNVSVFQIISASFYVDVIDALERNGLDPDDLGIEVTESGAMRNAELSLMTLRKLSDAGLRISLDDFGVGHSSLSHLKRFPVQELKVDRSFISHITECAESEAIVRAIIGLAKAVGLRVVAEGVETIEQQAILADMECDAIQGYLISRPIRASDVPAVVIRHNEAQGALFRLLDT